MEYTEYSCIFDAKECIVFHATYKTYLEPISITVQHGSHRIQTFTYLKNSPPQTILSYTTSGYTLLIETVLGAFLQQNGYPLPEGMIVENRIEFHKLKTKNTDILLFSTNTYTFRVIIKKEPFHFSVKIGGKDFVGCVELFLYNPDNRFYTIPKLAQVYSEPECWYHLGKKGNIVDLLNGSFQLCQMLFGVNTFSFEDNSNIECGITKSVSPPRKLQKPLSLSHLYIAQKGKTWYETHFNAFLSDITAREKYTTAINRLNDPFAKDYDYDTFAALSMITKEQYIELKPLYKSTTTWRAFFESIPKEKYCTLLYSAKWRIYEKL